MALCGVAGESTSGDVEEAGEEREVVLRHVTTSVARSIKIGNAGACAFDKGVPLVNLNSEHGTFLQWVNPQMHRITKVTECTKTQLITLTPVIVHRICVLEIPFLEFGILHIFNKKIAFLCCCDATKLPKRRIGCPLGLCHEQMEIPMTLNLVASSLLFLH